MTITNSKDLIENWNKEIYFMKEHCIKLKKNEKFLTFHKEIINNIERLFVVTDKNIYEILPK